jgi:hypothetical protein
MWLLTFLFALRVGGQALQYGAPQFFLPEFDDFQGSSLPYGFLLLCQLIILAVMAYYSRRVWVGSLLPQSGAGMMLGGLGALYLFVSVGRIAIALLVPGAAPWFRAWIPAAFHLVLALYVLTLAFYHVVESRPPHGRTAK